ncbi:MAG: twin-arginine translocation signal domain-containing protein [Nitrososphaerota archaeon]|nr:twin-arginine translocation signal domain-containing protein [Nitrososphaerota archaeon]
MNKGRGGREEASDQGRCFTRRRFLTSSAALAATVGGAALLRSSGVPRDEAARSRAAPASAPR